MSKTNRPPDSAKLLHPGGHAPGDPLAPSLSHASMFHLPSDPAPGQAVYGRADNATWQALEAGLSALEGAPTLAFPSGMAAITAAIMARLKSGDRVLMPEDGYYATRQLVQQFLVPLGVRLVLRPTLGFAEGGFDGFAVVFIETPSNPGLDLVDIAAVTAAVRAAGGLSIVDNTLMTPFGQRPLALGADIVVASDSKAPGGQSDVLMGHVASHDAGLMDAMRAWRTLSGSIPGPQEAWMLLRSLATLELRFERMCASATVIAERLAAHPKVQALRYPGLASGAEAELVQRQMQRPGFVIGLTLADKIAADGFVARCPLVEAATSFGGVHSSADRRARFGDAVAEGFLRLSIGIEPVDALWRAISDALEG